MDRAEAHTGMRLGSGVEAAEPQDARNDMVCNTFFLVLPVLGFGAGSGLYKDSGSKDCSCQLHLLVTA